MERKVLDPLGDGISMVALVQSAGSDKMIVSAARVSFGGDNDAPLTERDEKLIKYLLREHHGCYDPETEVLTRRGWVKWPEVREDDELAAVDPATGQSRFEVPERLVRFGFDGEMYHAKSQALDMMVTPNHRMVVAKRTDSGRVITPYAFEEARAVAGRPRIYCSTSTLIERERVVNPWELDAEAFAAFIGFTIGDGSIKGSTKNGVSFHLRRPRKIAYLKALCARLGIGLRELANDSYVAALPGAQAWFAAQIHTPEGEKCLPSAYLTATEEEVAGLLDGLRNSDGSNKRDEWVYLTTSERLRNDLQALGALNGFVFMASVIKKDAPSRDLWRLTFSRRTTPRMEAGQKGRSFSASEEWVPYQGDVFCATVSTGAMLVRRDNKIVVSGNSPFEHNLVTFKVVCPIFVDRQMVRHRIGTCLPGDALIDAYDTAHHAVRRPIEELWRLKHVGVQDTLGRTRILPSTQHPKLRCLDEASGTFVWGRAVDVYESGVQDVYTIDFEGGQLACTLNHRILTAQGWKRARDIEIGDELVSADRRYHDRRIIPWRLREGIALWTTQQRDLLIAPQDQCYVCGETFDRSELALDHVIPIAQDLARALDISNLRPACDACHRAKTNLEQPSRKGSGALGQVLKKVIRAATYRSTEMTYDIEMPEPNHNFVANGIVVHNSKNEISGRYVELRERVYVPLEFRKQAKSNRQASVQDDGTLDQEAASEVWREAWRVAFESYEKLLALGVTREQARGVLPLALYTESYYTFNVRSLLHFLELRDHPGAQFETQLFARAMADLAEPLFPVTFRAWRDLHRGE